MSRTVKWTNETIQNYLINHIKKSIQNDVGLAIDAYMKDFFDNKNGDTKGFFAIPRLLFPEIDGLGSYITGNPRSTVLNIKTYLTDIMSQIDMRYGEYAAYIALIYRHGLLHQHEPKRFKSKGKEVGWMLWLGSTNLPVDVQRKNNHLQFAGNHLMLDTTLFYKDTLDSVDIAADEILKKYKKQFIKSYKEQLKFLTKSFLLKKYSGKSVLNKNDFKFIKNIKQ